MTTYTLHRADFNMGEIVYENNVQLSDIGDKLYEITFADGKKQFRSWDVISMIGPYVQFDTCDSDEQIRCTFESLYTTQIFYSRMKPNIHPEVRAYSLSQINAL